jgi:pyruvate kinase
MGKGNSIRKTKIVCTIGPATASEQSLRRLIETGMNTARLNFSHGSQDKHLKVIEQIRRLSHDLRTPVAILQDIAGPKVRIGTFENGSVDLTTGQSFTLTANPVEGDWRQVSVSYEGLPSEVKPGDHLLLSDGLIELRVKKVDGPNVHTEVSCGGVLSSRKGVNCPSGLFGLPILREKDLQDLAFGLKNNVDYVALSFVRTAEDIATARREIQRLGSHVPIIAKIETKAALQNFDEILESVDGIMIARGDLAIETAFTSVPVLQKQLISKANQASKPAITATQMLYSMVESPFPTRAEVADVANAVLDSTDAVMLSEETTVGKYPVESVQTMASIILDTEQHQPGGISIPVESRVVSEEEYVAQTGCELAAKLDVGVIATLTLTGQTARLAAKYRPRQPILAVTGRLGTYRCLALIRGVLPVLLRKMPSSQEAMIATAMEAVHEEGWEGEKAVFLSETLIRRGTI